MRDRVTAVVAILAAAALGVAVLGMASRTCAAPEAEKSAGNARKPDVWFVPTPHDVVDRMLELAQVKSGDVVYDLGCGDGRIVIAAAKKHGCKAVGVELDPKLAEQSRQNARKDNVQHLVRIEEKDLFTVDLSDADVVTLYLLVDLNKKLIPQLTKLKPGARIVSNAFPIVGLQPDKVVVVKSPTRAQPCTLYLYTAPIKSPSASAAPASPSPASQAPPTSGKGPGDGKRLPAVFAPGEVVAYQDGAVLSRTLIRKSGGCVQVLAIDQHEELTEQAVAFEILICVLEGEIRLTVLSESAEDYLLRAGQAMIVPANVAHAAKAVSRAKILMVMIRP
jgi:quercetin dioxygenase-like cupin family protein